MGERAVTVTLQTADRTRIARITMGRDQRVSDLIKASRKRWRLSFGVDYQVANMSSGRQLLPAEYLTYENVKDGDTLMLQPFPTHGNF